jgi:hypothetical protein
MAQSLFFDEFGLTRTLPITIGSSSKSLPMSSRRALQFLHGFPATIRHT